MHGICFDYSLQNGLILKFQEKKSLKILFSCATRTRRFLKNPTAKIVWLGGKPFAEEQIKKKGNSWEMMSLTFHDKESFSIQQ
jgi:hypothetical protein